MSKINVVILLGSLLVSSFLVGCVSQNELNEVRQLALAAQKSADNAQNTASNASQQTEMNRIAIERMFQKIMGK
mgnify:FL=1